MCRHLAYLGAPRSLAALVVEPPHALQEQAWAPRRQRHGTVNVDGFGVGWYPSVLPAGAAGGRPVRYRRAQPMWTDASFASLAPSVETRSLVAAVRSATVGTSQDESAAAPFTHDRWLLSHNGRLHDWSTARKALLLEAADVPDARAGVDSALLFGLAVAAWQAGAALEEGLVEAARAVLAHGGGRLTMLAADGDAVAGLVCGEPMHVLEREDGVVVASEPHDDDPAWREVPDGAVVRVDDHGVHLRDALLDDLRETPHDS